MYRLPFNGQDVVITGDVVFFNRIWGRTRDDIAIQVVGSAMAGTNEILETGIISYCASLVGTGLCECDESQVRVQFPLRPVQRS
jgi:hypothetical protein